MAKKTSTKEPTTSASPQIRSSGLSASSSSRPSNAPFDDFSESFSHGLKIPKDRIAVLIGKDGEVKARLEAETKTKMDIDSKEGEVTVLGEDALALLTARDIVRAIARGFNPEIATLLLRTDYVMEIINIEDYGNSHNDLLRLRGRVIGAGGKSRRVIEELTDAHVSVYGKTVTIVGEISCVGTARRAVDMLLSGSPHRNVYKWLEKSRKSRRTETVF